MLGNIRLSGACNLYDLIDRLGVMADSLKNSQSHWFTKKLEAGSKVIQFDLSKWLLYFAL